MGARTLPAEPEEGPKEHLTWRILDTASADSRERERRGERGDEVPVNGSSTRLASSLRSLTLKSQWYETTKTIALYLLLIFIMKTSTQNQGIQTLLDAEKEASKVVQQARQCASYASGDELATANQISTDRVQKLKDARAEAEKEIVDYKQQKEHEFKEWEQSVRSLHYSSSNCSYILSEGRYNPDDAVCYRQRNRRESLCDFQGLQGPQGGGCEENPRSHCASKTGATSQSQEN